jgi:hypothetical protein
MAKKLAPASKKRAEHKQVGARFRDVPVVTVTGIVSASGPGGCWNQGSKFWTFKFEFDAWRVRNGNVQTRKMAVERKATERGIEQLMRRIQPATVLRIRARVRDTRAMKKPLAHLERIEGPEKSDAELNRRLNALNVPVTFHDKELGKFKYDRRLGEYEAKINFFGTRVSLTLSANEPDTDVASQLKVARTLWRACATWKKRIADYAVEALLPLANEWQESLSRKELTAKEFLKKIKLTAIHVNPDGKFSFWYNDGDVFCGHVVAVRGNLTNGPTDASIEG